MYLLSYQELFIIVGGQSNLHYQWRLQNNNEVKIYELIFRMSILLQMKNLFLASSQSYIAYYDCLEYNQKIMEPNGEELRKKKWLLVNKICLIVDTALSAISLLLSFILIPNECSMSFFLFLTIYFMGQSIQHFLIIKMPRIDVIKYDKIIKRYLTLVSIIEITYFFLIFMFWVKTELHPFYCFLCTQIGLPSIIGLLFIVSFVISLLVYIQFLYGYINRKYYLMALGGFEVERRMNEAREENMRRAALIEPYYNEYPVINEQVSKQTDKFFKFEDIKQDVEGEEVCSICLTRDKEGFHPIFTTCKHFFHRECIENWAKINGKCPQCRAVLQEQVSSKDQQTQ